MLNKVKQRKQEGFTIIEVMIVLAIAGLIMIVVFLAVPALQRSGRNNGLNSNANNVLTSLSNYVSNNNGTVPTSASLNTTTSTVSIAGASTANTETTKVDASIAAVSLNSAGASNAITKTNAVGTVQINVGTFAKCNATASGLDPAGGGTTRSYVLLYVAETGSGNIVKCIGG